MDRRFELRMGGSLSDASLEEGDAIPGEATYRIVTSNIIREPKTGLARFVDIVAEKQVTSRTLLSQFSTERQSGGGTILYDRTYQIALASSLATNSLEAGDTLPADATAEIIVANITVGGKSALTNMVQVTAEKQVASRTLLTDRNREEQRGDVTLLHRTYQIVAGSSLSTNSIENGDPLPGDAAAEITAAAAILSPASGLSNLAQVTARKYGTWAD